MARPWVWLRAGMVMAAMLGVGACDYFSPAQPEPPAAGSSFIPDYGSPDSTLATIAKSIADKGVTIGGTAYGGAFAESVTTSSAAGFHQFFWPQDVVDWKVAVGGRNEPADWGFALEQTFYNRFVRIRPDAYQMAWAPDSLHPDDIGSDAATIHRHYLVTSHASDGTRTSFLTIGYADLRLLRFSDGNWRIVRWDDRRDPNADPNDQEQVTLGRRRLNTQ